jgi:general secretion pathway protein D
VGIGGNELFGSIGRAAADIIPAAFGAGFVVPSSNFIAYQAKGTSKLIASTQIHAFNNEDSSARIGQRVPVQSAQFVTGQTGVGGGGVVSNVVNYEQTGLTLKFKPLVFPNQDVQVAMEIESKDVAPGGSEANPIFTERTIKGTARIQNNKTLLLASVASGTERRLKTGIPFLSSIPLLGRLFSAPLDDNSKIDIVISVTPRVIRAPAILPEDEAERPTGSLAVPTNSSLEAMIVQEEQEELLAAARRMPSTAPATVVGGGAAYVKAAETAANTGSPAAPVDKPAVSNETANKAAAPNEGATSPTTAAGLKPIDNSVKTLQLTQTADTSAAPVGIQPLPAEPLEIAAVTKESAAAPGMNVKLGLDLPEMKAGDRIKIPVLVQGSSNFRSGVIGLKFDAKRIAVRSVSYGDVFGAPLSNTGATPFLNQNGKRYVSLSAKDETGAKPEGTLAFIEIEALAAGMSDIAFDSDVLNFLTTDGKNFQIKLVK